MHLLVFLLPFEEKVVPPVLVGFLVFNLFTISWDDRVYYFKKRWIPILSFTSFYLVSLIGMVYTSDMQSGWFDLEVKLSMFLVPLFLLTTGIINKYSVFGVLKSFVFGTSLSLGIQFVFAGFNFYETQDTSVFYHLLLSFLHHPTYFAIYINFSLAVLLVLIFHYRNAPKLKHFALLAFLIVGIYQIQSRTGLLTLIILICYAFIYILFPRLKWKKVLYALFATILLSFGTLYSFNKYSENFRKINVSSGESSSGVRLAMWNSAIPLIKENFLFGVGTGDGVRELQSQFAKDGLLRAVRNNYNVHNQFIQVQVSLGIVGTLALVWALIWPLIISIKKQKLFFPLFAVILVVSFLTEAVFRTQAGVIYYALLNSVVFFTYSD